MSTKTENFILKAIKKHGVVYDYSLVKYVNSHTPIKIICPIHGEFQQMPHIHLRKNSNGDCPKCSYIKRGKARRKQNGWWSYEKSKKFVNNLDLQCREEWYEYCKSNKKPEQLPSSPRSTYVNEWESWPAWIGNNGKTKDFLPFKKARIVARSFDLRSFEDWVHFSTMGNRPNNIPFNPKKTYKDLWISWGDWLGYESRANGNLSGIIYILKQNNLPENVYKIGRTYRLEKRLSEHTRSDKNKFSVVTTFNVPIMKIAEEQAHKIALKFGNQFQYKKSKEHFEINNIDDLIEELSKILCPAFFSYFNQTD